MSDPLSIAVSGLNAASARIANAAQSIANASLTPTETSTIPPDGSGETVPVISGEPADIAAALVSIIADSALYGANAKVISAVKHNSDALLNIKV